MSEPGPDDQVHDAEPAPEPLGYRSGIDERADRPRVPIPLQGVLAFFLGGGVIFGAGFLGAILSDRGWGGLVMVIAACVVLGGVATQMRDEPRKRGWMLGIVAAIGLIGLIDGGCFIALR